MDWLPTQRRNQIDTSFVGISSIQSSTERKETEISIAERIRRQRERQQAIDRQSQNETQDVSGRQTQRGPNLGVDQTGQTQWGSGSSITGQVHDGTRQRQGRTPIDKWWDWRMSDSQLQRRIGDLFRNEMDDRIKAAMAQWLAMEETSAEKRARRTRRRYEEDKILMDSQRRTAVEREAARKRVETIDKQISLDIEMSRRLQRDIIENREDAEGNENIASQANAALALRQQAGGRSSGIGLRLDDEDQQSEIGAHLPMNRNQASMNGDISQSQQTGLSLQIGVDNISNQLNGRQQGESQVNGNGDNGNDHGNGNGDENGDLSNGQGSNGNGGNDNQVIIAASSDIGGKAEIDDDQKDQAVVESEVKEPELKIDQQGEELVDNNNLNRVVINQLRAQLTTLYDRPTTSREENFDDIITQLFDRYIELTNERTSNQQRKYFEGLTVKADNALVNAEQRQNRIKQIETELKDLYEIAEENQQPTFDILSNNLWIWCQSWHHGLVQMYQSSHFIINL